MSTKLLLLKSGEDVIAEVKEMCVGDEDKPTIVGYFLRYPCRVKLVANETSHDGDQKVPFRMQLTPWMPLSKAELIPIVADWVVTATEPIDELLEAYEKGVQKNEARKLEAAFAGGSETDSDSD